MADAVRAASQAIGRLGAAAHVFAMRDELLERRGGGGIASGQVGELPERLCQDAVKTATADSVHFPLSCPRMLQLLLPATLINTVASMR